MCESELARGSDVDPLAAFDRAVDRVEYALDFDPVFERRKVRSAFRERRYEIGDLEYERVGVSDSVALRPGAAAVRMPVVGRVNLNEPLRLFRLRLIAEEQVILIFEVPVDGPFGAVDLNAVVVFASAGESGRFEIAGRAVVESAQELRDVVDGNVVGRRVRLGRDRAFRNERLDLRDERDDLAARYKARKVDRMGRKVAERARARKLLFEPLDHGPFFVPVLGVPRVHMIDFAEPSFVEEPFRERGCGRKPIGESARGDDVVLLNGVPHRFRGR